MRAFCRLKTPCTNLSYLFSVPGKSTAILNLSHQIILHKRKPSNDRDKRTYQTAVQTHHPLFLTFQDALEGIKVGSLDQGGAKIRGRKAAGKRNVASGCGWKVKCVSRNGAEIPLKPRSARIRKGSLSAPPLSLSLSLSL